jgi:hypothetical protein
MYKLIQQDEDYLIKKGDKPLLTPKNVPVRTRYKTLAERLVKDLKQYGESPTNPVSIVTFHYAMIDFFSTMHRSELEYSVAIGLNQDNDWTFNCPTTNPEPMMNWMALFGTHSSQAEPGRKWLSSLTLMQLCAVCVIGRGLESVNIPFIVATKLDHSALKSFAEEVNALYSYISVEYLGSSLFCVDS